MANRSDGLPEGTIIDAVAEGKIKYIDAPAHLKETITKRDDKIVINFDAEVIVPEISNTPIMEFLQAPLTNERLNELVSYFAGDGELFKVPLMTRTELEEELAALEKYKGSYNAPNAPGRTNMQNRLKASIEEAPDERQWEPVEIIFDLPSSNEALYLMYGDNDELQTKNTFEAFVLTGDSFASRLSATKYDPAVGSTSNFLFSRGIIFTEEEWLLWSDILERNQSHKNSSWFASIERFEDSWIEEESMWLQNARDVMDNVDMVPDEAIKMAQDVLNDLGINGLILTDCVPGIQFYSDRYKQFVLNRLNFDPQIAKGGYTVTFSMDLAGLPGARSTYAIITIGSNSVPEGGVNSLYPYAPRFFTECITFFVTEDGVQMFKWQDMSQQVRAVVENTALLPFNEIVEHFASHLNFSTYPDGRERFDVSKIELRSAYTTAFRAPDRAWLIPVWVFDYRNYFLSSDPSIDEGVYDLRWQSQFSAIDGAWVMPANITYAIYSE